VPEGCLTKPCRECEWHIVRGGRLDCNYLNRLGIKQPSMSSFMDKETDEEKLKKKIEEEERRLAEARKALEELKKLKEEVK